MGIITLLSLTAFICAVLWAAGKCPGWVSVILLTLIHLLESF